MKIALTGALLASALVLPLAVTAGDFSPYVDSQGGISRGLLVFSAISDGTQS